jgi:exopolysaccharide production protein ExoZ
MISNLHLLRGLAAFAVVFYHTDFRIPGLIHTEFLAVPLFFVMSGFLMTYITRNGTTGFLLNRVIRIVPMYWAATLAFVFLAATGLINLPFTIPTLVGLTLDNPADTFRYLANHVTGYFTVQRATVLVRSLLFIPQPTGQGAVLGVGWSLNLEIFYYVIFGVALLFNRRIAPLLVVAVLLALWLIGTWPSCEGACAFYSTRTIGHGNMYFLAGILIFYIWRTIGEERAEKLRLVLIGVTPFIVAVYLWVSLSELIILPLFLTLPPVLVLLVLLLHSAGVRSRYAPLMVLGDASYSIYLTHAIVLDALRPIAAELPAMNYGSTVLGLLTASALSLIVGIWAHYKVERPLLAWGRRLADRKQSGGVSAIQTST